MDWQKRMNEVMAYIETHLDDVIDYDKISQITHCSEVEFRRMFSFLTQVSLSEYIRQRRLTVASKDIGLGDKIIDVAVKYGYESTAAFSRAFKKLHGITPSKVRMSDVQLKLYPPIRFRLVLMEDIKMENESMRVIVGGHGDRYGITVDMDQKTIHDTNEQFWSTKGNDVIGCLALPLYGAFVSEEKVELLGELNDKKVLDICCGTGYSLLYAGNKKAAELWGIDISQKQLDKAESLLNEHGFQAKLLRSAMEEDCGLPKAYFDVIYSVYGIGWSTDLDKTFQLIHSYLKKEGTFIFSWSHPIHKCVSVEHDMLTFKKSYFDDSWYALTLDGKSISLADRKLSTYINALAKAGFVIEELVEQSDEDLINASNSKFAEKAGMLPVTFVIKARKI